MDAVFGRRISERDHLEADSRATAKHKGYGSTVHDVILFYAKSPRLIWNQLHVPYDQKHTSSEFTVQRRWPAVPTGDSGVTPAIRSDEGFQSRAAGNWSYEYKGFPHRNGLAIQSKRRWKSWTQRG